MADEAQAPRDFAAFEPWLRDYSTHQRVLEAARRFATVTRGGFGKTARQVELKSSVPPGPDVVVEIDGVALLLGIASVGVEMRGANTSAAWFVDWLERGGMKVDAILSEQRHRSEAANVPLNCPAVPSAALRAEVLPLAAEIAERTVRRLQADARHLLFALLSQPPGNYGPFDERVTVDVLKDARRMIVERLHSSHEEGEDLNAWRALLDGLAPASSSLESSDEAPDAHRPAETVGTLSDAPALVDALGRQAFAEVLATRVKQVSETLRSGTLGNDSAFILHVDGPWGSGKSSILNFLKTNLEQSDPSWVIVEFNAWRNQQRSPAWWPIISHVWTTVRHEGPFKFPAAYWVWMRWTMGMRWLPLLLSGLLIVAFAILVYWWGKTPTAAERGESQWIELMDKAWKGVLALMALGGFAWTSTRALFFGSKSAAETYAQSSAEPFRRIVSLYERLIRAIDRPVAVFIDDIDRCECNYVIELLEGIQTLLRSAPVVYVVAGDRKWICSSFEKRYSDFGGHIGMPGRPLGYLFLDKVFQLSTAIPRLSNVRQAAYWKRLLETGEQGAATAGDDLRKLEADAETELIGKSSHEEIQQQIDDSQEGSLKQEALRAAAAKQTTSREAMRAAEHRLQPLAHLLEPNPRSMKRLVNAYGLNQARVFLEGRKVEVEALARWTIVELRWPILADYLATNWTDIADGSLTVAQFPETIRALLADSDVREVFGDKGKGVQLTVTTLGPILE